MEPRCPACGSDRVVQGRIGWAGDPLVFELPSQEKRFWRTLGPSVNVEPVGFLCVECGTVWSRVDKAVAEQAIARGGSDELLDRLRIPARPKRKWTWILFGKR
jgi:hypothetical protein